MTPKHATLTIGMIFLVVAWLVLTAGTVSAMNQNYEHAATARIVGNSPADIIQQLQNNKGMNLKNAQ